MSLGVRIAVIVPAHNAMTTLPACLDALIKSTRKPDEIIIFDDGLNPNIRRLEKYGPISIIDNRGAHVGRQKARNLAAQRTFADVLAFVDADVVVEKEALERLVAALDAPEITAAFGSYNQVPPGTRLAGLYVNLRHHWIHQQGNLEAETFWSGLGVVHADSFWMIGGFDANSRVEDIDLGARLRAAGKRIRFVPTAQGSHLKDWHLFQLWRTDVFDRAIPWSLRIANGAPGSRLNASPRERFAGIIAYGVLISLVGSFVWPWLLLAAAILLGLYIFWNRGLFRLIGRRGGVRGLLAGIALHFVYHIYASAIFIAVQVTAKMRTLFLGVQRQKKLC